MTTSATAEQCWNNALLRALDDAIDHLQHVVFERNWPQIRAGSESDEAALRNSLLDYERGLFDLLHILRVLGAFSDGMAWSQFKTDVRRASRDAGTEISLRTALDEAFYQADQIAPGNYATYLCWSGVVRRLLNQRRQLCLPQPASSTPQEARIEWALACLADLEEHAAFQQFVLTAIRHDPQPSAEQRDAAVDLQERLFEEPRYDLLLNLSLRYLSDCD